MSDQDLSGRLAALEARLARLETVLGGLDGKLDRAATSLTDAKAGIQAWVTDYVSLRLQQLVPETCEHEPDEAINEGPMLPEHGSAAPTRCCTGSVASRSPSCGRWSPRRSPRRRGRRTSGRWTCRSSSAPRPSDSASCRERISRASSTGRSTSPPAHASNRPLEARCALMSAGAESGPPDEIGEPVHLPIEDSLDLHSFPRPMSRSVVEEYLAQAHARGFAEVRLIHGRGIGVQRANRAGVLARHPLVAATPTPPRRGGAGRRW